MPRTAVARSSSPRLTVSRSPPSRSRRWPRRSSDWTTVDGVHDAATRSTTQQKLDDARTKISDGKDKIADAEQTIADNVEEARRRRRQDRRRTKTLTASAAKITTGRGQLDRGTDQAHLRPGHDRCEQGQSRRRSAEAGCGAGQDRQGKTQIAAAKKKITPVSTSSMRRSSRSPTDRRQIAAARVQVTTGQQHLDQAKAGVDQQAAQLGENDPQVVAARTASRNSRPPWTPRRRRSTTKSAQLAAVQEDPGAPSRSS